MLKSDELTRLVKQLRKLGVHRYADNGVELVLGPAPPSKTRKAPAADDDTGPVRVDPTFAPTSAADLLKMIPKRIGKGNG